MQLQSSEPAASQPLKAVHLSRVGRGKYEGGAISARIAQIQAVIGDRQAFWSYDLTGIFNPGHAQLTGVLQAIGAYCEVYIDEQSQLTRQDAEEIARQFDSVAYPIVTGYFGEPPGCGWKSADHHTYAPCL